MGKGKGAVSHFIAPVKPGTVMFEVDGASDVVSKEALLKAGKKLPIKVGFVDRNNVGDITFNHKFVDSLKGKGKAQERAQPKEGQKRSEQAPVRKVRIAGRRELPDALR